MPKRARRLPGSAPLWVVAVLLTLASAAWQWRTGAVGTERGEVEIAGQRVPYQLPSSGKAGEPLRVTVGAAPEVTGTIRWRRSSGDEPFQALTMFRDGGVLVGLMPAQPAGGRVEYQLVLAGPFGLARIPAGGPVEIRSRGEVPSVLAVLYLLTLALAMAVGVRAGLAALFARSEARPLTWMTAAGMTLGVTILGPLVQRSAFGGYWSGWPLGSNAVDHKALVVWLAWMTAAGTLVSAQSVTDRFAQTVVVLATVVLIVVGLLPRSLHLSRLGSPATEARSGSIHPGDLPASRSA